MQHFSVTGMSCAACSARVEKAVSAVPGVTECAVSLLTNSMSVDGAVDASAVISADESVQLVGVESDMEWEVRAVTPVSEKLDPSGISWAEWAEQNGKTLVPIGMEATPTLQFLKVNGQTTDTPLIGAFLTQNPDGTVSAGFQVDLSEEDVSHLKSCEVQLECRVGVFGKDGKATQWQKEILAATITFK